MKNRWWILIGVFAVIFYIMGNVFPMKIFVPNIDWNKTSSPGEIFYYFICVIQAIATIAAVVVALFNDDLKRYFKKPKLTVTLHKEELIEELLNNCGAEKKAARYHNSIDIFNSGNENVQECEIYIDGILFKGLGMQKAIELLSKPICLKWDDNVNESKTFIPMQGKKSIQIYEIFPPEQQSTPGGNDVEQIPPSLIIGPYNVPNEYCGGTWEILLCLYSPTLKPFKFKVILEWDGCWENRQMEMKNKVKNSIVPLL
jgi:hypothetical protein